MEDDPPDDDIGVALTQAGVVLTASTLVRLADGGHLTNGEFVYLHTVLTQRHTKPFPVLLKLLRRIDKSNTAYQTMKTKKTKR